MTMDFSDEEQWIIQIRKALAEDDLENDDISETPVSIFSVPKALMASDPSCYVPQEVAIGPYHHRRRELYEMERHKISAAKRAQKHLRTLKFHDLVEQLAKYEQKIRDSYHRYLDISGEAFVWMMAIDASFFIEILSVYIMEEKSLLMASSKLSLMADYERRKTAYYGVLRDIVMLENQIPLFVLRKMMELQYSSMEAADERLVSMLMGFYKDISPFEEDPSEIRGEISECFHLLDFMYRMIVPCKLTNPPLEAKEEAPKSETVLKHSSSTLRKLGSEIWRILSKLRNGPVQLLKRLVLSKPLLVVYKLPWKVISKLPGVSLLIKPIFQHLFQTTKAKDDPEKLNRPPLSEEITIPSVSELVRSGVRFSPAAGGISGVSFDKATAILYLPTITLDINSEVILRNLVAYEASKSGGLLVFSRFIDLMNGIIDTEEDVRILREKGVVRSRMKSDGEVAALWNGMNKSVELTRVAVMDGVIEDVNEYYSCRWKVKTVKFVERCVYGSWPLLALMATILLLCMTAVQSFCSVYSCSRLLHHLSS